MSASSKTEKEPASAERSPLADPAVVEDSPQDIASDDSPTGAAMEAAIGTDTRDELIRQAAYRRYVERGGNEGDGGSEQDWLDAEAEINQTLVE